MPPEYGDLPDDYEKLGEIMKQLGLETHTFDIDPDPQLDTSTQDSEDVDPSQLCRRKIMIIQTPCRGVIELEKLEPSDMVALVKVTPPRSESQLFRGMCFLLNERIPADKLAELRDKLSQTACRVVDQFQPGVTHVIVSLDSTLSEA